jgi:hypothetical protein
MIFGRLCIALIDAGARPKDVQAQLGHESVRQQCAGTPASARAAPRISAEAIFQVARRAGFWIGARSGRGKKHRLNRHERTVAKLSDAFAAEVIALKSPRPRDGQVFTVAT